MHSERTLKLLLGKNLIDESEVEIIEYGIRRAKVMAISLVVAIGLGIFMGVGWQCVFFLMVLIPLRSYAGGYHADTQICCGIISFIILLSNLLFMKYCIIGETISLLSASLSLAVILALSPIGNDTKRLDDMEYIVFKKKARIIAIIFFGIAVSGILLNVPFYANPVIAAMNTAAALLVAGWLKYAKDYESRMES